MFEINNVTICVGYCSVVSIIISHDASYLGIAYKCHQDKVCSVAISSL